MNTLFRPPRYCHTGFEPDRTHAARAQEKCVRIISQFASDERNEADIEEMERRLQVAWDALDPGLPRLLVESMERRLRAVQKVKGWYSKYWTRMAEDYFRTRNMRIEYGLAIK